MGQIVWCVSITNPAGRRIILSGQWFPSPALAGLSGLCFLAWATIEAANHIAGKGWRLATFRRAEDRGSYWLLIGLIFLSFCLGYGGRLLNVGVQTGPYQAAGPALMVVGVALRQWAIVCLGRYFSVVVAIETGHRLITHGPYRWLRHPAYTGGLLALLGFHLALGNWLSLLLSAATVVPALLYRIRVEEQALLAAFGEEYRAYQQRTWSLLPGF